MRRLFVVALLMAASPAAAQFTIPNYPTATYPALAAPDKGDFDALVAGIDGAGVLSGAGCTAQGSPDMTVAVAAGRTIFGDTVSTVASGNATITTADGTNPRLDLVVSAAGTKAVRAGTAATNPVFPALTAGDVVLCAVYVPASDTTIASDQIVDKRVFVNYPLVMPATTNPSAPSNGLLWYARKIGGRVLPKWIGPSGVDVPVQPALFSNNILMYTPTSGTTVTGGFGTLWAKGGSSGTVDTPTVSSTSITSQIKRTRHRNAGTTTNQAMGIISTASGMPMVWRGNAAGLGGFFFFARFIVTEYPAASIRIFAGLTAGTAEVVTSDTVANNTAGFWHDTSDNASTCAFVTRDGSTTNKVTFTCSLAAMQGFDVYIFAKPNDSTIYYRVDDINAGTTLVDSSTGTNLPGSTTFLGPQVEISNGTANTTVNTTGIGVNRIYIESDR